MSPRLRCHTESTMWLHSLHWVNDVTLYSNSLPTGRKAFTDSVEWFAVSSQESYLASDLLMKYVSQGLVKNLYPMILLLFSLWVTAVQRATWTFCIILRIFFDVELCWVWQYENTRISTDYGFRVQKKGTEQCPVCECSSGWTGAHCTFTFPVLVQNPWQTCVGVP